MSKRNKMNIHHRKPRSISGTNDQRNLAIVREKEHIAWHLLFRNYPAETIVAIINQYWIDPDYRVVLVKKEEERTCKRDLFE